MQSTPNRHGLVSNKWLRASVVGVLFVLGAQSTAHAANLAWAGRSWKVTSGGMAGVAEGSPNNVSVDANGYLHLKISNNGGTWTAAELFTTDELGFGTYQWQVDAPIDRFDKNVVLGLYPYGPAAGIGTDGTNEIDIEYSFWGNASGVNGDWTDYPSSGTTIGEKSYKFTLDGGTFSTSRFIWNSTSIQSFLLTGFQPVGSTTDLLSSWTYAPQNPSTNIPQRAMPLGINLWCFDAPPSDGKNVEVVIRDFQFVPEGTDPGGTGAGGASSGGAGGTPSNGGGGHAGNGGSTPSNGGGGHAGDGGTPSAAGSGVETGGSGPGGATSGGTAGSGAGGAGYPSASGPANAAGTSGALGTGAGASGGTGGSAAGEGVPSASNDAGGCSFSVRQRRARGSLSFALALLVLGRRARRRSVAKRARQAAARRT